MRKKLPEPTPDAESPEWTEAEFKRATRFQDLPQGLQQKLRSVGQRGPQKAPKKVPIYIRLAPEVAEKLRAMGPGWQARAADALREYVETLKSA